MGRWTLVFLKFIILLVFITAGFAPVAAVATSSDACNGPLIKIAEGQVVEEWVHRHRWRGTNTRLILDGSMPSKNSPSIEEIKLKMAEAIDAIKNLNPTDEADFDKIFDFEKVEEGHFSDFLGANGIAHLYLNYGYSSPIFLILPTGTHPLNLEAKKLFSTHGTLLEFGRTGKSRVDISRNTIVIPMDFHSLGLGERERALISRLSRQNVSEFEILSSTRPEVKAFLTDPENSIPHSLRFLSFASDPGSSVDFRYRISFRTGKVDTLAPRIAKALDSILKIPLVSNSQWVAVGFRSKGGDWIMSLPTHISGEVSEPFSASYLEIRKDFYKSMGADLFLIVHGHRHFKPHMIEFLKKVAKSVIQEPNKPGSVSLVLLQNTHQWGGLYYIHTRESGTGKLLDTTVYADQLQERYNWAKLQKAGAATNPFEIEN
jgi:hypothetical protein